MELMTESLWRTPLWIIHIGDILYDCWKCIYEPLFWLMYLLSCTWESHQQQKQRYFDDMMTFSIKDDGFHMPAASTTVIDYPIVITSTNMTKNISQSESNDGDVRIFRYGKSYIKRTLKAHLKSIRQKQRLLNSIMKRSLLRRARKIALIQQPSAAGMSMTTVAPLFIPTKSMDDKKGFYPSPPPPLQHHHRSKKFVSSLPPLKTLAHQGKLTPEIVSLSKSLIFF